MGASGGDLRGAGAGRADAVIGLVLLAIAGAVVWLAADIQSPPFVPVGPAFFPRLLAGLLALLAVLLLVRGLHAGRGQGGAPRARPAPALLVFGPLAGYLLLVPRLGFFTSTFLFVTAMGALLGERRPAALGRAVVVAAVATGACYLVFERYLRVLFPRGLVG